MLSYEKNYTPREDGRFVCSKAALMEMIRNHKPKLALPKELDKETFAEWQGKVKAKLGELLQLPPMTEQPAPKLLSSMQRDGYRVEKWEYYPDDYFAVPFFALIPDNASKYNKVPAVMCLLGSHYNKEFSCGEDLLDHPNCQDQSFPDRNRMGKYMVENGMAAFVFDNLAIGETSVMGDKEYGDNQYGSRIMMTYGYLQMGHNYFGMSVFHRLMFLKQLHTFDFVDQDRIGIASHSLGTPQAISIGLLSNKIKAIVYNEHLVKFPNRFAAVTEELENSMRYDGMWHIIPGSWEYFTYPDLCAAFAPRKLALTEGGSEENLDEVRYVYSLCGAKDNLLISYYSMFNDNISNHFRGSVPNKGLSMEELNYKYMNCDPPDHSFRKEPAIKLFKDAFGLK